MTTQMQQHRLFPNLVSIMQMSWLCRKSIIQHVTYFCLDSKTQPILRATLLITASSSICKNATSRNWCVNMTYMYHNVLQYDRGTAFHVPGTNKLMYSMQPDPFSWYGSGLPDCMTYLMK